MNFNFISPQKIYFGAGKIIMLPDLIPVSVSKIFIVVSKSAAANIKISEIINKLKTSYEVKIYDKVQGEPTVKSVAECTELVRSHNPSLIISIGGGSVIDTAKAAAGFAPNSGELTDYIEGVGKNKQLANCPINHIAVPTTSGTGSEMTKNAVIKGIDIDFKRSLRHDSMVPSTVIIDPNLTVSVPPKTTAYSGMDAITQLIESYISKKSNAFTDALALEGLQRAGESLIMAYSNGSDIEARTNMSYASALSGMCLANSGLGAVHGIAAGLGASAGVPHGLACAVLLSKVIKLNAPHIHEKASPLCKALTGNCSGNSDTDTKAIIEYIASLTKRLDIPDDFSQFCITQTKAQEIIKNVSSSSMSGNPYKMSEQEILSLII